jgi:mobilome CxxCx(11)CxxC protein
VSAGAQVDPRFAELHDRAADAFATAAIFARRAKKYRRLVEWLTFIGLAIPVVVGGIALADYKNPAYLTEAVLIGVTFAVMIGVLSLWSVVKQWPDNLDYSSSSNADNHRLSDQLKALATTAVKPPADFDVKYKELVTLDDAQNISDNKKDISEWEKVYGHRAALLQFKRKCDVCGEIPLSMKMPFWGWSRCPRCGGPKKK